MTLDNDTLFTISEYCAINPHAVVTYRGKRLSQVDKEAVLSTRDDRFLTAFFALPKEEQIAVRLRWGDNIHDWFYSSDHAGARE